jgi:sulfur carrier protein ThiS
LIAGKGTFSISPPSAFLTHHQTQKENHSMKCLFINNDGGGFADTIDIAEGTTVAQFFVDRIPNGRTQDYLIRVNRQPVPSGQVLREGDRISITPTKIEGASA